MTTQSIPDALIHCFEDLSKASQRYRNAFKAYDLDDNLICELKEDLRLFYKRLIEEIALPSAALQVITAYTINLSEKPSSDIDIDDELMDSALNDLATVTLNKILENAE